MASIIIAGAGLAGLSAAHELAKAGSAVTILDARDHAGGRVRTIRDFVAGQHGELGGEFVEPEHKELLALCREFGLPLVRILRGGFTCRFSDPDGTYHLNRTAPWEELADSLAPLVDRYTRGGPTSRAVREMANISLRDWLLQARASPRALSLATALRGFFLADAEEISVWPVVEQMARGGAPTQAVFFRIDGGNDRLAEALVRGTPARMLLGHTIRVIGNSPDRVVVGVTDSTGQSQEIEADFMVAALPACTLRDVEIRPGLPDDQRQAIDRLAYGRATKALLQTAVRFLGVRHARAFATDSALGAFWDASEEQGTDASIIAFLGGGSASAQLRDLADDDGSKLISELCWLRAKSGAVTRLHVADWTSDPWSRGGYAFFDPAFDPAWRPLLGRRAGRIVFAGEHTSERWQGYMNGAVESGQRAARELLKDIG